MGGNRMEPMEPHISETRQQLVFNSYTRDGEILAATYKDCLSFSKTTILYLAMSFQLKALISKVLIVTR
jgi:hypothetical protein